MSRRITFLLLAVVAAGCSGKAGGHSPGTGGSGGIGTGTGGTGLTPPPPDVPIIISFTSDPPVLPTGGGSATLMWNVMNADTISIDNGIGTVTATSASVSLTASTIYTLTATNSHGTATALAAISVGQNPPSDTNGRYAAMISPTGGESFLAPTSLRLVGAGHDPNVFNNTPTAGHGGNASSVQFFVDDTMVLTVDGANAEFYVFKGFVDGIGVGQHRVWMRAIFVNPALQLDSPPMIIDVTGPPTYAQTMDLTADVTVGSAGFSFTGSASGRVRMNGHGHSIVSSGSTSGPVTLQYVDFFDMGDDAKKSAIDVTTTGNVVLEDSRFDKTNSIRFNLGGTATASIKRNLFQSNMRQRLGQDPQGYDDSSLPAVSLKGASTGQKVFAGNNVGAGWAEFIGVKNWLIGGDTDADSNVLIGPRVGFVTSNGCTGMTIKRNYSHHVYYGGWSQGANFELEGSPMMTVQHNVIYGSSWPVRGVGCEFSYNLILHAGHEWLWPEPNGNIHHNVFVGGQADVGGIFLTYAHTGIKVFNNTIDGLTGWAYACELQMGSIAVTSNAFVNVPNGTTVHITGATVTSDYNFFDNPQTTNYSDGRKPAHDVIGDAMLPAPLPNKQFFNLDESQIWTRGTSAAEVLALYRTKYTPAPGSPLIDKGDPAGGDGNDIGAVGAGSPNAMDKFGQP